MNEEKVELIEETDLNLFELSEGDDENNLIKDELLASFWSEKKIKALEEQIEKIDTDKKSPHELAQLLLSI